MNFYSFVTIEYRSLGKIFKTATNDIFWFVNYTRLYNE